MGGEGSIARSFMMLSFFTAALLMGVRGIQDVSFMSRSQPAVTAHTEQLPSPERSPLPPSPSPGPVATANIPLGSAGGAGGDASKPLPAKPVAPISSASPSSAKSASPLSRIQTRATGEFVPAVAQLPNLLNALPDRVVQVIVDLSDRQVYLYKGVEEVGSYPVAIGKDGWETPTGQFQVIDMQVDPHWQHPITRVDIPPGPGNPLGSRWVAFLPMDDGVIGFHGTYQTELIGQAVSHGCIRMRNADIEAMYEHLHTGVPVIVRQ